MDSNCAPTTKSHPKRGVLSEFRELFTSRTHPAIRARRYRVIVPDHTCTVSPGSSVHPKRHIQQKISSALFSYSCTPVEVYYIGRYYYLISENAGYSKSIHQQAKVLAYRWFICPGSPRCAVSLNRYRYDSRYQNCGLTGIQVKSSQVGDEGAARAHVQWPEGPQWDRHHRLSSSCARFTPSASFVLLGARKGPVKMALRRS